MQEVKNAIEAYNHINDYNYKNEEDFLKAKRIMTKYLDEDNGGYRSHGEGVKRDNKIIYVAPESILIPTLMKSLFDYSNKSNNYSLNEIQNRIIELITNDKSITQNKIADIIGVNVRTIKRNFKVLIDNNIIERVGSDKTGYWEILK